MSKTRDELIRELAELDLEESEPETEPVPAVPAAPADIPVLAPKKKIPRTERQIAAFKLAMETKAANAAKRKAEREAAAEAERKVLEEKLIKKAIALKKKQMKARAVIDELPEVDVPVIKPKQKPVDETAAQAVAPVVAVVAAVAAPPKPVIHFF